MKILNPNHGWGACALLLIAMACGLVATPSAARADTYYYGGYTYYTPSAFYAPTVQTYTTLTSYNLYVDRWAYQGTDTESFTDATGNEWKIVKSTYKIKRGYEYLGSYTYQTRPYYQQLCGRIRWCPDTRMYIYVCECGRTFYWVP